LVDQSLSVVDYRIETAPKEAFCRTSSQCRNRPSAVNVSTLGVAMLAVAISK
jgi:hypothetical protein